MPSAVSQSYAPSYSSAAPWVQEHVVNSPRATVPLYSCVRSVNHEMNVVDVTDGIIARTAATDRFPEGDHDPNNTDNSDLGALSRNGISALFVGLCCAKLVKHWIPNVLVGAVLGAGMMYKAVQLGYAEVRWKEIFQDAVSAYEQRQTESNSTLRFIMTKLSTTFWVGVFGGLVL